MQNKFDIIVVGGGHAGIEAAFAAARMGCETLILTMDPAAVGRMSCNPAVGGLGKGHLVREIDAMGGIMGRAADATGIQFRLLNTGKGPAVQAPRCQSEKDAYPIWIQNFLKTVPNLTIAKGHANKLIMEKDQVTGIQDDSGEIIKAKAVILTTGTFLDAKMFTGLDAVEGGRVGEQASRGLGESMIDAGIQVGRLKTGTPARLDLNTIDTSKCELQPGDVTPTPFSFLTDKIEIEQTPCYITYTNPDTHGIILDNLDQSPMFMGKIEGIGPRYCPSIEDKCVRFEHKDRHQIFLEPEGRDTNSVYPNGISTSLPAEVQKKFVRTIPGLEKVEFIRYGYAVEYTYVPPKQLYPTFETRAIPGLYLAGQINGTSGYEEAGAQGMHAGINAVQKIRGEEPFVPLRPEAYMGVMIDDLISKDHREPYRMFTSRAEFRLLLRCDNAELRLSEKAHQLGLLSDDHYDQFKRYSDNVENEIDRLKNTRIKPSDLNKEYLEENNLKGLENVAPLKQLLSRPEMSYQNLIDLGFGDENLTEREFRQVILQIRYEGYIRRQLENVRKIEKLEHQVIPIEFDYKKISGLTNEAEQNLSEFRPSTIGQASRLSGVNPADISVILIHLKKNNLLKKSA